MPNLWVNGIVARRDKQPYVQLSNDNGVIAQLTMAEARYFANDILKMASRTEADALLLKFFAAQDGLPEEAPMAVMEAFRDFRAEIDQQVVQTGEVEP